MRLTLTNHYSFNIIWLTFSFFLLCLFLWFLFLTLMFILCYYCLWVWLVLMSLLARRGNVSFYCKKRKKDEERQRLNFKDFPIRLHHLHTHFSFVHCWSRIDLSMDAISTEDYHKNNNYMPYKKKHVIHTKITFQKSKSKSED